MASIPSFVRAYLGLLDTAVQAARDLREHAPELPVEAVGNAMQLSLKAQQRFTELAIRGDDVISRFRGAPDEAPAWATFDDEPAARADPPVPTADDAVATALGELADRRSATEPTQASTLSPRASMVEAVPATKVPAKKASSRKAPARKAPARKAPATTAAQPTLAPRASMVESVPARKIPATKIPVKKPVKNGASMVEIQHPASKTPTTKPVKTGASMVEIQRGAKKSPARKAPARKTPARKAPTVPAGPASVSPASVSPASESARAQSAFDLTPDPHEPTTDSD